MNQFLVRRASSSYPSEPGLHSHNQRRRHSGGARHIILRVALALLVIAGLAGVGYYGYTLADQYIYQAYQNGHSISRSRAMRRNVL